MSDQEFPPCRVCGERHVVGGLLQCRDGLAERVARQDAALAAEVAAHGLTKAALAVEHTARCTAQTDLADEVEKHAETRTKLDKWYGRADAALGEAASVKDAVNTWLRQEGRSGAQVSFKGDVREAIAQLVFALQGKSRKAEAEVERLQAIVDKIPHKKILAACAFIDAADHEAMCADGPIVPTATLLSPAQLQACLSALWNTLGAADAAKEKP